jgi:putative Holliday junction resolvase
MRILAIDPGEKRIGVAISDPTETIARPLMILKHVSREIDAKAIVQLAVQHEAGMIIVGQSFDDEGNPSFHGRQAARLALEISKEINTPVILWDESDSSKNAYRIIRSLGKKKKNTHEYIDHIAAAEILKSYLESKMESKISKLDMPNDN